MNAARVGSPSGEEWNGFEGDRGVRQRGRVRIPHIIRIPLAR